MTILSIFPLPGISYTHDPSACLVSRENILFAYEEERLLRAQHAIGHVPERAALLGMRECNETPDTINHLAIASMENCRRRADFAPRLKFVLEQFNLPASIPVSCVPHHLAHSALAVLTSPFDECSFLTLDGGGDGYMGHWGEFKKGKFRIVERFELSPAIFYSFVTGLCGFPMFEEGKPMGLAGYGRVNPKLARWFRSHFFIGKGGTALVTDLRLQWKAVTDLRRLDPDSFSRHKYKRLNVDFVGEGDSRWIEEIAPADIARTGQEIFQELIEAILRRVRTVSGMSKVACSGGAFLNVAANGHLARHMAELKTFVPMAPHDAGLALGAALWVRHLLHRTRPQFPVSPYLGPIFSRAVVEETLKRSPCRYRKPANFHLDVAKAIAAGKIVGWFKGRAEYGARALGARSVLADPRNAEIKARVNQLMKRRDWFMPFAPSILEEHGPDYFEDFRPSPYMNTAFRVRKDKIHMIPAAVHVDGTCRAHTVSRHLHPEFHNLISHFHELTGLPLVLNTSFNQHGLPMVATPKDALNHLINGCVDLLAIEGYLVDGFTNQQQTELIDEQALLKLSVLRHAAHLARVKKTAAARKVLKGAGLAVKVTQFGLFSEGRGTEWRFADPIEEIDVRWIRDDRLEDT